MYMIKEAVNSRRMTDDRRPLRNFGKFVFFTVVCGLLTMVLHSCNSTYTPKPKGYYKINFPEKKYRLFEQAGYPYSFEYPVYAKVVKDSTFLVKQQKTHGGSILIFRSSRGGFM